MPGEATNGTPIEAEALARGGYSRSALVRRGWTESLIKVALGWPDTEVENPYYASGAPMMLYGIARVHYAGDKAGIPGIAGEAPAAT
jgi:hypothetical protein